MEIIVRNNEQRIDPRHPESTDPDYARAVAKGKELYANMKFESDAERRDYIRIMSKNPNNILGFPKLYPDLEIKSFISMEKKKQTAFDALRDFEYDHCIGELELFCNICKKTRTHGTDTRVSLYNKVKTWCKSCGNDYKQR